MFDYGLLPVFTRTSLVRLPVERVEQSGEKAFFAFRGGAITALSASQPGIEQVPEGVNRTC